MLRWRSALYTGLLRFAGGDRRLTLEEQLGTLDDRHVDHLAVDCDSADTFSQRLVIGADDAAGVIDLLGARPKLLVQDWHLARMDHRGADKTESAGPPNRRAKRARGGEIGAPAQEDPTPEGR